MHQLGNIVLKGFNQPASLEFSSEAIFSEHPKLQGKPSLQSTGLKNTSATATFNLHISQVIPEDFIQALTDAQESAEILPLSTEAGDILGSYVITTISVARTHSLPDGSIIAATIDVGLLEWATVDGVAERSNADRSAGFAVGATDTVTNPTTGVSVEGQAMAAVFDTSSTAASIDSSLLAATANPDLEAHTKKTTKEKLLKLLDDANFARSTINAFGGQKYTDTRGLDTDLITVINSATTMYNLVDSSTTAGLRTLVGDLQTLISAMQRAAQVLAKYTGTRS